MHFHVSAIHLGQILLDDPKRISFAKTLLLKLFYFSLEKQTIYKTVNFLYVVKVFYNRFWFMIMNWHVFLKPNVLTFSNEVWWKPHQSFCFPSSSYMTQVICSHDVTTTAISSSRFTTQACTH